MISCIYYYYEVNSHYLYTTYKETIMKMLFIPEVSDGQRATINYERAYITEHNKNIIGFDEVTGNYSDTEFFSTIGIELIDNLINYGTTKNLKFSPEINKAILDTNGDIPITNDIVSKYKLIHTPFTEDKVQFIDLCARYLTIGTYNQIPTATDFCSACYDKSVTIRTIISQNPKHDLYYDICKFVPWCNKVKDLPIYIDGPDTYSAFLDEVINRTSVMAMFIILTLLSRMKNSRIGYYASGIQNQLITHFREYLN